MFRDIVCRYLLSVLTLEKVKGLSCKYICKWSKRVKQKHLYIKSSYDVAELRPRMERFDKLCKYFYEVAEEVADSNAVTNSFMLLLMDLNPDGSHAFFVT